MQQVEKLTGESNSQSRGTGTLVFRAVQKRVSLIIIGIMVCVLTVGFMEIFIVKPMYESTSTVRLRIYSDTIQVPKEATTIIGEMLSDRVLIKVVALLQLNPAQYSPETIRDMVHIEAVPESYLIKICVQSDNPKIAADLANTIPNEYIRQITEADQKNQTMQRTLAEMKKTPMNEQQQTIMNKIEWNLYSVLRERTGVELVSPADSAAPPVSKNLWTALLIAVIAGLIGMVLIAWLLERTKKTFDSAEELKQIISLPVFVEIPAMSDKSTSFLASNESVSEAYRKLLVMLEVIAGREKQLQSFLVTNINNKYLGAMNAANFAFTLADQGKQTLLIDCGSGKSLIAEHFAVVKNGRPVEDGVAEAEENNLIQINEKLFMISIGNYKTQGITGWSLESIKQTVNELMSGFDCVVINGPSTVNESVSLAFSSMVDCILVSVVAKGTEVESLRRELVAIRQVNEGQVGIIVNSRSIRQKIDQKSNSGRIRL